MEDHTNPSISISSLPSVLDDLYLMTAAMALYGVDSAGRKRSFAPRRLDLPLFKTRKQIPFVFDSANRGYESDEESRYMHI